MSIQSKATPQASAHQPFVMTVRAIHGRHLPAQEPSKLLKDKSPKEIFERRRLITRGAKKEPTAAGAQGPDFANFKPGRGLVGHDMFHNDYGGNSYVLDDRAILMQSIETYMGLMKSEQMGDYFAMYQADSVDGSIELILDKPSFGEQVVIEGGEAAILCVGDVFQAENSPLKIEITSPRFPCSHVDRKFNAPFGSKGVRRYTLSHAAAGWFCRVLKEGHLEDGTKLTRIARPHPQWSLTRCATALYGCQHNRMKFNGCRAEWGESVETLREFIDLPQLGDYEWGEEAELLLEKIEKAQEEQEAEDKAVFESESWCTNPFGSDSTMASVGACACLSPVFLGMLFNWSSIFQ